MVLSTPLSERWLLFSERMQAMHPANVLRRFVDLRAVVIGMVLMGMIAGSFGLTVEKSPWFFALLLGIGLLGSTFGIDLDEMRRKDWKLLVLAVTVGVTLKAAIIGAAMFLLTGEMRFFVIAITVAQMDPLSVGALLGKSKLSVRAENLLRAWAALDDPVTVALAILVLVIVRVSGADAGVSFDGAQIQSISSFGVYVVQNIALMASLIFFWERACKSRSTNSKLTFTLVFMTGGIVIGAIWFWMFGIALVGLFMRPDDNKVSEKIGVILERATTLAFYAAGVIVGTLIWVHGIDIWRGVALGAFAFASQAIVTTILVFRRNMSRRDHLSLASGHQNGITACLLALATHTVPIIVPAIVTTHLLHYICNRLIERYYDQIDHLQPQT